jgi:hypothetical protein
MRAHVVLSLALLLGCGGQTNGASDAASPSHDAESTVDAPSDIGPSDTSTVTEASTVSDASADAASRDAQADAPGDAAMLPEVGSPACEDVPCVLCADGNYHCHTQVYPPCMAGISTSMNCESDGIPYGCFMCASDGGGDLWECVADGGWDLSSYECTP